MNRSNILLTPIFLAAVLIFLLISFARAESRQNSWEDKIDPYLLELSQSRQPEQQIEFIVMLEEQAEINLPIGLDKSEQTAAVYDQLRNLATDSQVELINKLKNKGADVKPYLVINAVHVTAPVSILSDIASRPDVAYLHNNLPFQLEVQSVQSSPFVSADAVQNVEWGVEKIGAPLVWANGITGTGAIIAGQDTGYHWNHPALINQYRGWNGDTADHSYNWHDAISSDISGDNNNPCGYSLTAPCDDVGSTHGTHTMGTMIGETDGNQIGVAPGAEWISCRNMEEGYGTPETYIDCFEWFLAPTDLNNQNPDPSKAPHVVNNSWGCPTSEGCNTSNFNVMDTVINNLRSAGIVVVTSAGNDGRNGCSSVKTPAAIYAGAFSIGATTFDDEIADFSSRGPVTADGSGRMKPNVTAPGSGVRSATGTSSYGMLSGTSMAAPHVAGAVGLMISAYQPIAG
ncbi:MAG: S8 family serine peptidase, partial [Chloroflexota bacterium]